MKDATSKLATVCLTEILPPAREDAGMDLRTCLWCQPIRLALCMDEDGGGICEECLSL